eukprot:Hpha_TRINITY_DN15837_c1_g2::TRINITY_DN15837_c1_g2_i1::g.190279::m.190279
MRGGGCPLEDPSGEHVSLQNLKGVDDERMGSLAGGWRGWLVVGEGLGAEPHLDHAARDARLVEGHHVAGTADGDVVHVSVPLDHVPTHAHTAVGGPRTPAALLLVQPIEERNKYVLRRGGLEAARVGVAFVDQHTQTGLESPLVDGGHDGLVTGVVKAMRVVAVHEVAAVGHPQGRLHHLEPKPLGHRLSGAHRPTASVPSERQPRRRPHHRAARVKGLEHAVLLHEPVSGAVIVHIIRVPPAHLLRHAVDVALALRAQRAHAKVRFGAVGADGAVEALAELRVTVEELNVVPRPQVDVGVFEHTDVVQSDAVVRRLALHRLAAPPSVPHHEALEVQPLDGVVHHRLHEAGHVDTRVALAHQVHVVLCQLREDLSEEGTVGFVVSLEHALVGPRPARGPVTRDALLRAEAEPHRGGGVDGDESGEAAPRHGVALGGGDAGLFVVIVVRVDVQLQGPKLQQQTEQGRGPRTTVVPNQDWVVGRVVLALHHHVVKVHLTLARGGDPAVQETREDTGRKSTLPAWQAGHLMLGLWSCRDRREGESHTEGRHLPAPCCPLICLLPIKNDTTHTRRAIKYRNC